MYLRSPATITALILSISMILTQCETSEERAERHYQSGLELLEAGDPDRALVELRNVFKLNGLHRDARATFARIKLDQGKKQDAYGQYLRLVDQYPNDLEGRRALGEMALTTFDWEAAERHIPVAYQLAPEDNLVKSMQAALNYRAALIAEDDVARADAVQIAELTLASNDENQIARKIIIDQLLNTQKYSSALVEIDRALELNPDELVMHELKLRTLGALSDQQALGDHLRVMTKLFPENEQVRNALFAWFAQRGDTEGAEAFLRDLVTQNSEDPYEANIAVVQFLQQTNGSDAAMQELTDLVEKGGPDASTYRGLRASLSFDRGNREEAMAELEQIVEETEPSDRIRNLRVTLARMLEVTGNNVGARAQIEKVLEEDTSQVQALKMRAGWLIADDKPGEAIAALRSALDQNPRDSGALTLMADAHLRDGSRDLAGERLALAVEVSNQGVTESLRYANFLAADDDLSSAETVLIDAMRSSPGTPLLLDALGGLYLRQADWLRARDVIEQLRRIGGDQAETIANALQANLLLRQENTTESISFLQGLIDSGDANLEAMALIVRSRLENGEIVEAEEYLDAQIAEAPENDQLKFLRAGVHVIAGDIDAAETLYRDIISRNPGASQVVQTLYALQRRTNQPDAATQTLDAALAETPNSPNLLWIKAGELEGDGDFEGSIAIYESLYEKDSNNPVVANNLASLITTHRQDAEGLERAFVIARRLRGSDVPAFQDTYGWIEHRRGNTQEALRYLEPAAEGLPNDPLVQFHLGMAYVAAEETTKARAQLERALELAGDTPLPQLQTARDTLAELPQ